MDREKLICAHFDAHSDLVWVKDLEPKFKAAHLDAAEMEEYREAWTALTEVREWDRWLDKTKGMTDAELQREIAEWRAEITAFRKEHETPRNRFQRILEGKVEKQPEPEKMRDKGREM